MFANILVLAPDGIGMFRTSERHARWYLSNDLAEQINDKTIRLLFEPGGPGHRGDPFYLSERPNICVICGSKENLSRHHVVPICYRRYFPDKHQRRSRVSDGGNKREDKGARHWFYDIMAMCKPCHNKYEPKAFILKKKLAKQVNVPMEGLWIVRGCPGKYLGVKTFKSIKTMVKHQDKIPENKQEILWDTIRECYPDIKKEKEELISILKSINKRADIQASEEVVKTLKTDEDFDDFYIMWRRHFVDTMKPKFISEHWDVNRRVCEESNEPY